MKRGIIVLCKIALGMALMSALALPSALASPVINSIDFDPSSNIWMGESIGILVGCTDSDGNYSIGTVRAAIKGADGYVIPSQDLVLQGGIWSAEINQLYLDEPNTFTVNVTCTNNNSQSANAASDFIVHNFTSSIDDIYPHPVYLGDQMEIVMDVRSNDAPVTSGVDFDVTIDGAAQIPMITPPYDPSRGWIIHLDSLNDSGDYQLDVTAQFDRISDSESVMFTVNEPIKFEIEDVDKSWVSANETVRLDISALDRGAVISLNSNNFEVKVGGQSAEIVAISPSGNRFRVELLAPAVSSGTQTLTCYLEHGNYTYTDSESIKYVVSAVGSVVNDNEDGYNAKFTFTSGSNEKFEIRSDNSGEYSSELPKGTYELEAVFPYATATFEGLIVDAFNDPIKYTHFSDVEVPGVNTAGLHVIQMALPFSRVTLEMKYDESKIVNEDEIKVYKCSSWNSGQRNCYGNWIEITGFVDKVRNIVSVDTSTLSAYGIGTLKRLSVDYNMNKQYFGLRDVVRVRGMVVDEFKKGVANASVHLEVEGGAGGGADSAGIDIWEYSDSNGIFTIEFLSPEEEGNFSFTISAEKTPYLDFEVNGALNVVKSREVSIVFPDSIRLQHGDNLTQEIKIVNIGQANLFDLNISLIGVLEDYFYLPSQIEELRVGQEKKVNIYFSIPSEADKQTIGARIQVFNEEVFREKTFGFTVVERESVNETAGQPEPITGFFITLPSELSSLGLPEITGDLIFIIVFAAVSFSVAILLKRRKIKKFGRLQKGEIQDSLSEIGLHLKKRELESFAQETLHSNIESITENIPNIKESIPHVKDTIPRFEAKSLEKYDPDEMWKRLRDKWEDSRKRKWW